MHNRTAQQWESVEPDDLVTPQHAGRSGRAAWDERGNSIWEWQTAPGVFTREVDEAQMRTLTAGVELKVVEFPSPKDRLFRRR
jgi:hypothetical protein